MPSIICTRCNTKFAQKTLHFQNDRENKSGVLTTSYPVEKITLILKMATPKLEELVCREIFTGVKFQVRRICCIYRFENLKLCYAHRVHIWFLNVKKLTVAFFRVGLQASS